MDQDELFPILQSFASLAPIKNLVWPTSASNEEVQSFLVDQLISSEHFRSYPPSVTYQKSFWKWIISGLEEKDEEVREEIYSHYLSLLDQLSTKDISQVKPPPSYVTYIWRDTQAASIVPKPKMNVENCHRCTLLEARTVIESGTTGLRTWTASIVLAEYLMSRRGILKSSRILELGSGAGFLGITLARMQIEDFEDSRRSHLEIDIRPFLCLTDLDEQVLKRCESNVKLPCNKVLTHPGLRITSLDWGDALDDDRRDALVTFFEDLRADLILGADLVYDDSVIPALVATLRLALAVDQADSPEKKAIVAATRRKEDTLRQFKMRVEEAGLRMEDLDSEQDRNTSYFLRNQPDTIGESTSHIQMFVISNKTDMC